MVNTCLIMQVPGTSPYVFLHKCHGRSVLLRKKTMETKQSVGPRLLMLLKMKQTLNMLYSILAPHPAMPMLWPSPIHGARRAILKTADVL